MNMHTGPTTNEHPRLKVVFVIVVVVVVCFSRVLMISGLLAVTSWINHVTAA